MKTELNEASITGVGKLAQVPIAFNVDLIFDVTPDSDISRQFALSERKIDVPYLKDYDGMHGERPTQWATRFDIFRAG